MKKLYYYVQRCPNCQSRITGRYIKMPKNENEQIYTERESLRAGELIKFAQEVPFNNCYCEECGYEWHYEVTEKLISEERIEEEKTARRTPERFAEFIREEKNKKKTIIQKIFGGLFK